MDFSIDMHSLGDADSITVWSKDNGRDYVTIIDGGNPGDANKIIDHFEKYIKPNVELNVPVLMINTHPHQDHIGGMVDLVHYFHKNIRRFYYNDPIDYLNALQIQNIRSIANSRYSTPRIMKIANSLNDTSELSKVLARYGIEKLPAFSDMGTDHNIFQIVGPSREFYLSQLAYFSDAENLKTFSSNIAKESDINEVEEGLKPCEILDEKNDASAENLTSVLTMFTDSSSRRYLFTADAGIDSFESSLNNGYNISDLYICQLPHHGSRRNINTNWVSRFNPSQYWISAIGNKKHPRKAVISCIKKNLPHCNTYSTHKGGTKHVNSISGLFPQRNWSSAVPL